MTKDNDPLPAYLLAQLEAKNHAEYIEKYGNAVVPMLARFDGEVLVASATASVREGKSTANWTVVIRFPSLAQATKFYDSKEYEPLKALRMNQLTHGGTVVLVEGIDAATLASLRSSG